MKQWLESSKKTINIQKKINTSSAKEIKQPKDYEAFDSLIIT